MHPRSGETPKPRKRAAMPTPQSMSGPVKHGPRQYGPPPAVLPAAAPAAQKVEEKIKPQRKPKAKADPKLVAAARELRDRYLEHVNGERVNENPQALTDAGKYDVSRALAAPAMHLEAQPLRQLPSAA